MRQAAVHWNMHNNRPMAEKLQRKALKAVTEGEARPEVVAEVRGGGGSRGGIHVIARLGEMVPKGASKWGCSHTLAANAPS